MMKCTKAAMFAELPSKRKVSPLRDSFAGSLRCHLKLSNPNSEKWSIDVDGQRYWWKDGGLVIFDETFVQQAKSDKKNLFNCIF